MSRLPPFPTSRRSSSQTRQSSHIPPTTRPLHITRPAYTSRPDSPTNTTPVGPARPRRSELRDRRIENGTERASLVAFENRFRDSASTTHSGELRSQQEALHPPANRKTTEHTSNGAETTSTSLASALDAFHSAGTSRRRRMTNASDEYSYQRQRQEEMEAEKARQQRYQERALRKNRTTRIGDIDGMYSRLFQPHCSLRDKPYSMRSKTDGSL